MKCCYVTHCDLPCSWNPVLLHLFVSIKNENEEKMNVFLLNYG